MRSLDRLFKSRLNGTGLKPLVQYIKDLFSNNEQGVWYDPSDLSTLYQDAEGTIPVTAVEQPVGLVLDKSKGLILRSELVINGTFDVDANWTKNSGWGIADGKATKTPGTAGTLVQLYALTPGKTYKVTYEVSGRTAGQCTAVFVGGTTVGEGVHSNNGFRSCILTAVTGNGTFGISADSLFNGSIDNFSVRELPGNHATQITATSRPVLSARVNLLTETEFRNGVADAPLKGGRISAATIPGYLGAIAFGYDGSTNTFAYKTNYTVPAGTPHTIRLVVRMDDGFPPSFIGGNNSSTRDFCLVAGGAVISSNEVVKDLGNNTYQVTATVTTSTANANCGIIKYAANSSRTFKITAIDVRPANTGTNLPDYQRVNTATDYDTAGFPYYLRFDGTDDWLVTPSIDFTGTDKMMVCAGVRKLSDSDVGMLVELSANGSTTNGTFQVRMFLNSGNAGQGLAFMSRGTALVGANTPSVVSPSTIVFTGVGDISADIAYASSNSVKGVVATTDQGTGTYGNHPIYIGRRGGTSNPFNGHLYSLIIRGAATSDSKIKSVEKYINTKTRAYTS